MSQIYLEEANKLPVYDECDILIVGGGAAGHSAAVAASRANPDAKIILMERYGYFGGNVTGGLVLMVPSLSWGKFSVIRGLQEEWFSRLDAKAPGSYMSPKLEDIGKDTPALVDRWGLVHGCTTFSEPKTLVRAPYYEPNHLKIEFDLMVQECKNVKMLLHSWGTKPIMEGNVIKGVIFESKEGRKAVFAKIVIDATGDGDIFGQTDPICHGKSGLTGEDQRDDQTALVWRCGGVDYEAYARWLRANPVEGKNFINGLFEVAGYKTMFFPAGCNDTVWFNNWISGMNCIDLDDIRATELLVRNSIRRILDYCKETIPFCFKDAYIVDIAPQLGTRGSRRLDGELYITMADINANPAYDDVIAWSTTHSCGGAPLEIPFRCIVSKATENLMAPGRHLSADERAIGPLQLIPQCVQTGQAAGVAAAVAIKDGTTVKTVDIKKVQYILSHEQDVPLPRQDNTDPELVAALEAFDYGRNAKPFRPGN
ncbi:MAG: FAD-dependent oxidoreductase [Ruminococcaceae bacterium]|nr:FAD-dependent oxidoreductase [Oscillospiraceae bacterium]